MSILNKTANLELTQFGGDVSGFANLYSVYNSDMQKIDLSVSELSSSLIGVADRVATLEGTISEISDKADNAVDVANNAKDTADAMDGRVTTLETKVDNLETWSGGVDVTLEAYDGRLDAIEDVIATVSTANINDLIARIDALEQKVDANTQSIDTLNDNMIGAVNRITGLETGLGTTNAELNTVKDRVTNLETCCQEVRDILNDHNSRINKNASDISELDTRLTRDETNIAGNASDITILATQNNTQAQQIDDLYNKYNALDPESPSSLISRVSTLESKVGTEVLTTTAQDCTGAINELDGEIGDMNVDVANLKVVVGDSNSGLVKDVGDLSSGFTQIQLDVSQLQSSMVGVAGRVSNVESNVTQIQLDVSQLQSSVIGVSGRVTSVEDNVGDLSQLNTTDKTDLVSAINEVDGKTDVYSANELKTNKVWTNGKPIYRKIVSNTMPSTGSGTIESPNGSALPNDFETIVSIVGIMQPASSDTIVLFKPIPFYNSTSDYILTHVGSMVNGTFDKNSVYVRSTDGYKSHPYTIIVEYTKSTD